MFEFYALLPPSRVGLLFGRPAQNHLEEKESCIQVYSMFTGYQRTRCQSRQLRAAYGPTLSSPPHPRVGVVGRCPGERALGGARRTQRHNLLLSALHRLALAVLVARDLAAWQVVLAQLEAASRRHAIAPAEYPEVLVRSVGETAAPASSAPAGEKTPKEQHYEQR